MEKSITLKSLNAIFKDIRYMSGCKLLKTEREYSEEYGDNGTVSIYSHPELPSDVYIQKTTVVDSYGENELICSLQFVTPTEKRVINYETI